MVRHGSSSSGEIRPAQPTAETGPVLHGSGGVEDPGVDRERVERLRAQEQVATDEGLKEARETIREAVGGQKDRVKPDKKSQETIDSEKETRDKRKQEVLAASNLNGKTDYEILGITTDSTPEGIRAAYRILAKKHHPDYGGDPANFRTVNGAYQRLYQQGKSQSKRSPGYSGDSGRYESAHSSGYKDDSRSGSYESREKADWGYDFWQRRPYSESDLNWARGMHDLHQRVQNFHNLVAQNKEGLSNALTVVPTTHELVTELAVMEPEQPVPFTTTEVVAGTLLTSILALQGLSGQERQQALHNLPLSEEWKTILNSELLLKDRYLPMIRTYQQNPQNTDLSEVLKAVQQLQRIGLDVAPLRNPDGSTDQVDLFDLREELEAQVQSQDELRR